MILAILVATCVLHAGGQLPSPSCTPGSVDRRVTQSDVGRTICRPGYSTSVRPSITESRRLKRDRLAAYGIDPVSSSLYELDHLIPLEIGGSSKLSNLWPQRYDGGGTREKDGIENSIHRDVCSGRLTIRAAQRRMRRDWRRS